MKQIQRILVGVRQFHCSQCANQCRRYLAKEIRFEDAAEACPLPKPKWEANPRIRGTVGLGDAVAFVAQPIAKAIDAVAGTHVAECGGCKKRRAALNRVQL